MSSVVELLKSSRLCWDPLAEVPSDSEDEDIDRALLSMAPVQEKTVLLLGISGISIEKHAVDSGQC